MFVDNQVFKCLSLNIHTQQQTPTHQYTTPIQTDIDATLQYTTHTHTFLYNWMNSMNNTGGFIPSNQYKKEVLIGNFLLHGCIINNILINTNNTIDIELRPDFYEAGVDDYKTRKRILREKKLKRILNF